MANIKFKAEGSKRTNRGKVKAQTSSDVSELVRKSVSRAVRSGELAALVSDDFGSMFESAARRWAKILADPHSSRLEKTLAARALSVRRKPFPVKAYRIEGGTISQAKSASLVKRISKASKASKTSKASSR